MKRVKVIIIPIFVLLFLLVLSRFIFIRQQLTKYLWDKYSSFIVFEGIEYEFKYVNLFTGSASAYAKWDNIDFRVGLSPNYDTFAESYASAKYLNNLLRPESINSKVKDAYIYFFSEITPQSMDGSSASFSLKIILNDSITTHSDLNSTVALIRDYISNSMYNNCMSIRFVSFINGQRVVREVVLS